MFVRPGWFASTMLALAVSACNSSPTPTAPSGTTLTNLTITPVGGGTMIPGGVVSVTSSGNTPGFGAFAQFGDGTGRYVEATWTSSDTSVLSIDGTSMVARSRGVARITATFQGRSDDEQITVEGGVPGSWAGSYVIDQCTASTGSLHDVLCTPPGSGRAAGIVYVGATLPITMEISESGTDLTGTVSLGTIRGVLTGMNRGGGFFYLLGSIEGNGGAINVTYWDAKVERDSMDAFINYEIRIGGLPGVGAVSTRLVNVTRR